MFAYDDALSLCAKLPSNFFAHTREWETAGHTPLPKK